MPIATIAFDFDPLLRLSDDLVVRWATVALAAVVVATLVIAGRMARRSGLRADDLLYIVVGVVPGAVVLGRIGYGIAHADAFAADPLRLVDPAVAGADLGAAVVGGTLTGAYVVWLLGAPIGRWAHLAAVPLLVALGAGKLTMVLGGSGQGVLSDAPWSTAYLGPGPWGSLAPALPAHPSQAYEGWATLVWAVAVVGLAAVGAFRRQDGRALLVAIGGWAALRAAVSLSWRDPAVTGELSAPGALAVVIAVGALVGTVILTVRARRSPSVVAPDPANPSGAPAWPDPGSRPRF